MRILYILAIVLFITLPAKSQSNRPFSQEPAVKIIKFYPNPAVSQITFDFEQSIDKASYSFQVYNFVGKKVLDLSNVSSKTVVDVTDYYRGVYIFQLKDKSGKMIDSGKFQVAH